MQPLGAIGGGSRRVTSSSLPDPAPPPSSMNDHPAVSAPSFGSPLAVEAASRLADTRTAALEVAERIHAAGIGPGSVVMAFASFHHAAAFPEAIGLIRRTLAPSSLLGTTAAAVLDGGEEIEGRPALAALALRVPGVAVHPIRIALDDGPLERWSPAAVRTRFGFADDGSPPRAIVLFADPFGMPAAGALAVLGRLHPRGPAIPVFGGIASGSSQIGGNLFAIDEHIDRTGIVGLAFHGPIEFSSLLSTAGRGIGRPLVVTASQGPVVRRLGGMTALEAAQEACSQLSDRERACLQGGLLLGIAAEETGEGPGRNDYLLRPIAAAHPGRGNWCWRSRSAPVGWSASICATRRPRPRISNSPSTRRNSALDRLRHWPWSRPPAARACSDRHRTTPRGSFAGSARFRWQAASRRASLRRGDSQAIRTDTRCRRRSFESPARDVRLPPGSSNLRKFAPRVPDAGDPPVPTASAGLVAPMKGPSPLPRKCFARRRRVDSVVVVSKADTAWIRRISFGHGHRHAAS